MAHGIGAVLGQVAFAAKSSEIPAVRDLLAAFTNLAGAVVTVDAMHTQTGTAELIIAFGADYVMTEGQHAHPVQALEEAAVGRCPLQFDRVDR